MNSPTPLGESADILKEFDSFVDKLADVRSGVAGRVFGQSDVIDRTLECMLAGGHALLVGPPGVAKTLLVESIANAVGLSTKRVQFTPDLMPSDILGAEVLEESADGARAFRFIKGPVFCQLLMADEINRASPRTQSALLQAMQERRVTIAGASHDLPAPFHVLATQNPLEQEGTYPLPEAQLDRFLMQIDVGFPDVDAERRMLIETTGAADATVAPAMNETDFQKAQNLVRVMPVGEQVVDSILSLVRAARPDQSSRDDVRSYVAWGPGPRASQALMLGVRARALLDGRHAPSLDDVAALAGPVLQHRIALTFAARADGMTVDAMIGELLKSVGG